ncbi:MAG: gliding motility-associated C-terminal domain-containing protein [Bacteroidetes bacterium]|nr:gliding motility-associated C-terminal domain-containing protein [Bacteroidota bacterium]
MIKRVFIFCFILLSAKLQAQIDREFWFVAPEVDNNHGDRPIYFRFTAFSKDAHISISKPGAKLFRPYKLTVPANKTISLDLTSDIDGIENSPADKILDRGLFIKSDAQITAYYDIADGGNPAIFPLKGRNALGQEFYIPSQTDYRNEYGNHSFEIVATEDNTVVTIFVTNDVVGHKKGSTYSITMNKGETYSARAKGKKAIDHLGGSKVTSDKPIAITISDDSVYDNGSFDECGDQLVPVSLLGTEHIAIKGFATLEKVYITAVKDNTDLFFDGATTAAVTLKAGETYRQTFTANALYIKSSNPVYVLHLTGIKTEYGESLLPPIVCTGSKQIGFVRSAKFEFYLMILTQKGNEAFFTLNGQTSLIQAADFNPVPGTSNWMVCTKQFSTTDIPVAANLIYNSNGVFHLGILNAVGWSSEYGYFSNYSSLNLGPDIKICDVADSVTIDAGPDKQSYLWNTGSTAQTIVAHNSGKFWVKVKDGGCDYIDTVKVSFSNPKVDLGKDKLLCTGENVSLKPDSNFQLYTWSDGSHGKQFKITKPGKYWIEILDTINCKASDSINVKYAKIPTNSLPDDTFICTGHPVIFTPYHDSSFRYTWQDGSHDSIFKTNALGTYWVNIRNRCDTITDTAIISSIRPTTPINLGNDTSLCEENGDAKTLSPSTLKMKNYLWQDGSTSSTFTATKAGLYSVIVTNSLGCKSTDSIRFLYCPPKLIMPSAFTPDGDGLNDYLHPYGYNIIEFQIKIYNRWGEMIFESNDINRTWDGSFENLRCPIGVYHWQATFSGLENNKPVTYLTNGTISIIR